MKSEPKLGCPHIQEAWMFLSLISTPVNITRACKVPLGSCLWNFKHYTATWF